MLNDKFLKEIQVAMEENNSNDFMFLKGQLRNIQLREKENKEVYFLADLKVAKKISDSDIYGLAFDTYHICFTHDFVRNASITVDKMRDEFKDNEVFVWLTPNCKINSNKNSDTVNKFNSANFYVNDIMLLTQIKRIEVTKAKVLNI